MEDDTRKVLLTGAGGFLGSHLLPELTNAGFSVVAVTSRSRASLEKRCGTGLGKLPVEFIATDDRNGIAKEMAGINVVLNCGFPRGGDGRAMARGLEFVSWLFQTATASNVGAVVNISSQSVYDQHRRHPAVEDDPVCPVGDYAVAKYATELMLEMSCASMPHTSVRLASLIGPGFDQRVVNKMAKRTLAGERITVQENGSVFGYLDVRDAVAGVVALAQSDSHLWNKIYNLGPMGGYTLCEIANEVGNAVLRIGKPVIEPLIIGNEDPAVNTTVDSKCLNELVGWNARIELMETVATIVSNVAGIATERSGLRRFS